MKDYVGGMLENDRSTGSHYKRLIRFFQDWDPFFYHSSLQKTKSNACS
jgi:hypothetical protein